MARSNYADVPIEDSTGLVEHTIRLGNYGRAYTPTASERDIEGAYSSLAADSMNGDWSWKPQRDKALGHKFVTFRGVPAGAPELYRLAAFSRS